MLKGLALTPPAIGRIAIGKVVEKNNRRLPQKDDEFTITSQVQHQDGWIPHPADAQLRQAANSNSSTNTSAKLRSIPVRLLFDDPDLSLRANYTRFDRATGRPLCVGDGERCKRSTPTGIQSLECPSPAGCPLADDGSCKPYARLHVRIDTEDAHDELGSFVFRTTGFNSIRTLLTRLRYFQAVSGGLLAELPLELRLRGKSTTLSHRTPVYYVDLTLRPGQGLQAVVARAREQRAQAQAMGLDQQALDEAARQGLALGAFEELEEEGGAVVEEFYPETAEGDGTPAEPPPDLTSAGPFQSTLERKLARQRGIRAVSVSTSTPASALTLAAQPQTGVVHG